MLFRIFLIGKTIRDIKSNPSKFAGEEARGAIIGIFILPIIIVLLGLIFLFVLGFTNVFGGPYGFFKVVFFIGLFTSFIFGLIIKRLLSFVGNTTIKVTSEVVENIKITESKK